MLVNWCIPDHRQYVLQLSKLTSVDGRHRVGQISKLLMEGAENEPPKGGREMNCAWLDCRSRSQSSLAVRVTVRERSGGAARSGPSAAAGSAYTAAS